MVLAEQLFVFLLIRLESEDLLSKTEESQDQCEECENRTDKILDVEATSGVGELDFSGLVCRAITAHSLNNLKELDWHKCEASEMSGAANNLVYWRRLLLGTLKAFPETLGLVKESTRKFSVGYYGKTNLNLLIKVGNLNRADHDIS